MAMSQDRFDSFARAAGAKTGDRVTVGGQEGVVGGKAEANKDKVKHPDTKFDAKYPYNQTYTFESGHTVEFDNTPSKERIRISHKSGTYTEISSDGRRVDVNQGEHHMYNKGGFTLTMDKNGDFKFNGHMRIVAGKDAKFEIAGDMHAAVGGDLVATVKGGGILAVGKDLLARVMGNLAAKVSGTTNVKSDGAITVKTDGPMVLQSAGKATVESSGDMHFKASKMVFESDEILLGGEGANRELSLKGTIDTRGDSDVANLSTKVKAI